MSAQQPGRLDRLPDYPWDVLEPYADRLGIEQVAYSGRQWTRDSGKWQTARASKAAVIATMYRKAR